MSQSQNDIRKAVYGFNERKRDRVGVWSNGLKASGTADALRLDQRLARSLRAADNVLTALLRCSFVHYALASCYTFIQPRVIHARSSFTGRLKSHRGESSFPKTRETWALAQTKSSRQYY
ncbi:hypothetical protein TKK_0007734 [Trichogramma kaykai]